MKKGQAPNRKTLAGAFYGQAAEDEAGKHLELLEEYKSACFMRVLIEEQLAAREPGVNEGHVEARKQQIFELKERIFKSWEKVSRQPGTLRRLADIAERNRDGKGAMFEVEYAVILMYRCGLNDHRKLFAYAEYLNPKITESKFSRIVARYKLTLKKAKPGPQPGTAKRSGKRR